MPITPKCPGAPARAWADKQQPMAPKATSPPSRRPARFTVPALAVIALVCAALAWWLVPGDATDMNIGALIAILVVVPAAAGIAVLLHRDRSLRQALAALGRSQNQHHALEQELQLTRRECDQLTRAQHRVTEANEKLERESATDGLTGITNRRRFDEILGIEWMRAARSGTTMSLLMFDIDHFKRFNDHYGHVAGDECLRRVAQLLHSSARRAGDLVTRYGGEEFVVLLPGARLSDAEELAQRCQQGIAAMALPHASSPTADHVTFSIGIAFVGPSAAHDPASLVNAADTAMYRAKTAGRARYVVATRADWEIDKDEPRSQAGELV